MKVNWEALGITIGLSVVAVSILVVGLGQHVIEILIRLLYAFILFSGVFALVLLLKHPTTIKFLRSHKSILIVILVASLIRILMIISFPFFVISGDGGDGIYYYRRIWMMARGNYQGNLSFVTGYPFFISFLGVLLIQLGESTRRTLLLLLQHLISIGTIVLIYRIVWLHTKNKLASFLAGVIAALSLTDALWAHRSRPVWFGTFLSVAGLWSFSVWLKKHRNFWWAALTGVLIACATLSRNFPVVFLGCFVLIIPFIKDALRRRALYCIVLIFSFGLSYYSYIYFVQYRSTGMFAMRGMGIGLHLGQISYRGNPNLVPFNRDAGEYTNQMVAYTHCIRESLPHMPMKYWGQNLFNKKEPRAPSHMTKRLKDSVSNHSKYALPAIPKGGDSIAVDRLEFAYYLGVPETKKLFEGYAFEQIRTSPIRSLRIVFRRILDSFRVHRKNFVYRLIYFPKKENMKILKKGFLGFSKVEWPSRYKSDAKIPFANLAGIQLIEWSYNHILYDWWLYLVVFVILIPDILKRTSFGQLSTICILLVLSLVVSHAFVTPPLPSHMAILEPFYKILFGLAAYRVIGVILQLLRKFKVRP